VNGIQELPGQGSLESWVTKQTSSIPDNMARDFATGEFVDLLAF